MLTGMGGFGSGFEAIQGGDGRGRRDVEPRRERMDPFDEMHRQMNGMMQNFGRGMLDMRMPDTNGGGGGGHDVHSFSHSSVYSYTSDGRGPPKVFQAAKEERRAPGGVRESKKAVKDSETGLQKMAVGHHLGDRGHVIERSQNLHSGQREEKQDFIGLTENDGATFNDEWTRAAHGRRRGGERGLQGRGERREVASRALPESTSSTRPRSSKAIKEGK